MIRVAVDAMGGDHAPGAEVAGTVAALAAWPDFVIQLVGRPEVIEAELARHPGADRSRIEIIPASQVVGMAEKPLAAIRAKRDSSLAVGIGLQPQGRSDAFVSAGNTGAVLAASTVLLGLLEGCERATVAPAIPAPDGPVLILDGGANVDCSARELVGFATLGTVYAREVLGRPDPCVGLLSIGEEEEKGNAVVKEAHQLLKQAPGLHFVGNVEGRDIVTGHAHHGRLDVVVCDGFVGNAVLKFYESVGKLIITMLRRSSADLLARDDVQGIVRFFDYATYGGAPLLGVKGITVICHGASDATAIQNGIRVALHAARVDLPQRLGAELAGRAQPAAR